MILGISVSIVVLAGVGVYLEIPESVLWPSAVAGGLAAFYDLM